MAFVDELKIHIKAGNGGHGVERWLHEKGKEFMGPAGGNGGKGGDVFVRAVSDLDKLAHYRHKKEFAAGRGEDGQSRTMHGKDGEDLIIDIPQGSLVTNLETGRSYDVSTINEPILILSGGRGGLGNEYFKSSTNVRPTEHTNGKAGEEADFTIEVLLAATLGLVGLPNAGKSSLLNALTNADAKVGDYQFTTLEPNLGAFYSNIIADIPGLIEGASEGKGLGHKFLKHVLRTKILAHCVSLENESMIDAYKTIRGEMTMFDKQYRSQLQQPIADKDEIIIITKADALPEKEAQKKIEEFKKQLKKAKVKSEVFEVSAYDDISVDAFKKELLKRLKSVS